MKNLKKSILTCIFIRAHLLLSAQTIDGVKTVSSVEYFLPAGLTYAYEMPVAPAMTVRYSGMFFYTFGMQSNSFFGESDRWGMLGYGLSVEPRRYYNHIKRQVQGKNVRHNAAGYFALRLRYAYEPLGYTFLYHTLFTQHTFSVTPLWGWRRSWGKHFYFDGSIGLGCEYGKYSGVTLVLPLMFSLGYAF